MMTVNPRNNDSRKKWIVAYILSVVIDFLKTENILVSRLGGLPLLTMRTKVLVSKETVELCQWASETLYLSTSS